MRTRRPLNPRRAIAVLAAVGALLATGLAPAQAATVTAPFTWSGYQWVARTGGGGPTVNGAWDANNAFVDSTGALHLRITNTASGLKAAEVRSVDTGRGYGTYTYVVNSRVDTFDPNVVAGLFTYDDTDSAQYGHREIDVEASRWGNAKAPVAWTHTYWPTDTTSKTLSKVTATTDPTTTHVVTWSPGQIVWRSYAANGTLIRQDTATGSSVPVPGNEQVMLNLWVYGGKRWQTTRSTELVIRSFTFTPAGTVAVAPATTVASSTVTAPPVHGKKKR